MVVDLEERLAALEDRRITLRDLPLRALQDKLETDWQPNASILLGSAMPRGGIALVTWPGGSAQSNSLVVAHGLGRVPTAVTTSIQARGGAAYCAIDAILYTATTFTLQLLTVDASTPIGTVVTSVAWIAL